MFSSAIKMISCSLLLTSCCIPLLPGRERWDEDIRITDALRKDKDLKELFKKKKERTNEGPAVAVLGDQCSAGMRLFFTDQKRDLMDERRQAIVYSPRNEYFSPALEQERSTPKVYYTPEEAFIIAQKVQYYAKEFQHSVRINIREATGKVRYVIGAKGEYLKVK